MINKFKLIGKVKYIYNLILNYKDWYNIVINRLFGIRTRTLHLRNGLILIGGPNSLILDLVDEIFLKKVYNPTNMKIIPGSVVVDIGANIGVFSLYAAINGAKKIYSIEPLATNINLIKKNFDLNKFNKPTVINCAVSNKNKLGKLYIGDLDSHGLLFKSVNSIKYNKFQYIPLMTLDKIIKIYNIKHIGFLKIDCEGSEGDIIKSMNKETFNIVDKISIEYHDNVSTLKHDAIENELKKFGYVVTTVSLDKLYGYIYARK